MNIDDIKFKNDGNGSCAYYIYDGFKYYITDEKDGYGYKYVLERKRIEKNRVIKVKGIEEAVEWIKSNIKDYSVNNQLTRYCEGIVYEDKKYNYFASSKQINIVTLTQKCSLGFDCYSDCLNYAKDFIYKIIKEKEPQQITFF